MTINGGYDHVGGYYSEEGTLTIKTTTVVGGLLL